MGNMKIWILTFNRPHALNRLINQLGNQGQGVCILSNHPTLKIAKVNEQFLDRVIINTLNSPDSNAWTARAWNVIMQKAFEHTNDLVALQDDTSIRSGFIEHLSKQREHYDFIAASGGDQFFFIRKSVLQRTGWFDERYIGSYCQDADYWKRVYMAYNHDRLRDRISIEESHNWGFSWNACGLFDYIDTEMHVKAIDPDYVNQHYEIERIHNSTTDDNPTLKYCQQHFKDKWGIELDNGKPVIADLNRKMRDIDWYPAYSKKFDITFYDQQEKEL
jgi:hypothetical protein